MKIRRIDFYPDDWLSGTRGLSNAKCGLYWNICALIYSKRGKVSLLEIKKMFSDKRFQEQFDELCALDKVTVNGAAYQDILHAPETVIVSVSRCDEELIRTESRLNRAANAAAKRWKNKETGDAIAFPSINKQHTTYIKQQKQTRASPRSRVYDPRFARWFDRYPERVGKGAAEAAFLKALKKGATEEELIAGVERYEQTKPPDRPWCNPATWLNQERWLDEPRTNGRDYSTISEFPTPRSAPPKVGDLWIQES